MTFNWSEIEYKWKVAIIVLGFIGGVLILAGIFAAISNISTGAIVMVVGVGFCICTCCAAKMAYQGDSRDFLPHACI